MTSARRLIRGATFDPADLKCLRDVFDEVWTSIAPNYRKDAATAGAAQQKLATIILDLAKDGQLGPLQITRTAGRLMREDFLSGFLNNGPHRWFR
jgi:hypothetical protein